MMSAKIAMIEFRPNVLFYDRKSPRDPYFTGPKSDYFNDLMKHLNLNATLLKAKNFGNCNVSDNCTGIYSTVQKGQADFSLLIVPYYFAPGIIYGPYGYPQTSSILSLPVIERSITRLDVLQIFTYTPLSVYVVFIFLILSLYMILNATRKKNSRTSLFSLFSTFINYFSIPRPRLAHSILVMILFLFLITFLTRIIFCSIDANLIKMNPAKYLESLEEVLEAVLEGKVRVYCIKNMRAHSAMLNRHENIFKQLLSRMKHVTRPEIGNLTLFMVQKPTVVLEIQSMIGIIEGLFCGLYKNLYIKLRTKPFLVAHTALTMNSNISNELRRRVTKVFSNALETDHHMRHFRQMKLKSMIYYGIKSTNLFKCEFELEYTRYLERNVSNVHPIGLEAILVLIKWQLVLWSLALLTHYHSIYWRLLNKVMRRRNWKKRRGNKRPKRKVKPLRERMPFTPPNFKKNTRRLYPLAHIYPSTHHSKGKKEPSSWSVHKISKMDKKGP